MTTRQLRLAFWRLYGFKKVKGYTQNDYPADIRLAWVEYVDHCYRDGLISDRVANNATLV